MYVIRLAMRLDPDGTTPPSDYYDAAREMAVFCDARGCAGISIPQHHASPDGYLPSPLVLASALAAATERVPIMCMALLLLHYDPVKLAEDMAVLDIVSHGRVSYVIGLGYRPEERAMFEVDSTTLAATMEESIGILRAAWTGEEFEHPRRGRMRVTPKPYSPGGPMLSYGGHSLAAARRAARLGMMLMAEGSRPELEEAYAEEAARCQVAPVGCLMTPPGAPTSLFVAEDVDRAWDEIGPYMLRGRARLRRVEQGPGRRHDRQPVGGADRRGPPGGEGLVPRRDPRRGPHDGRHRAGRRAGPAVRGPAPGGGLAVPAHRGRDPLRVSGAASASDMHVRLVGGP